MQIFVNNWYCHKLIISPDPLFFFVQANDKVRPLFKGHSDGRNPLAGQINLLSIKAPKTPSPIDVQPPVFNKVMGEQNDCSTISLLFLSIRNVQFQHVFLTMRWIRVPTNIIDHLSVNNNQRRRCKNHYPFVRLVINWKSMMHVRKTVELL